MKIFISGGCKNGKSSWAQELAVALGGRRYYIATMIPADEEDELRIARHVEDRKDMGFTTLECGLDIRTCLQKADSSGTFLMDSVTALLSNEMFRGGTVDHNAPERIATELAELADEAGKKGSIIFVSDYIYSDARLYDGLTEEYRKGLALVDRRLARCCDIAAEVCCGNIIYHKGKLSF